MLNTQNNSLGDVEVRLKQSEDKIKHIDDTIDGLHKTVAIFEGRHIETIEMVKKVTVLRRTAHTLCGGNQSAT